MSNDPLSVEALCAGLDIPDWVQGFDHIPGGKVVFGWGTIDTEDPLLTCQGSRIAKVPGKSL